VPEIQDHIGKVGFRDSSSFQPKLALAVEQHGLASVLFLDLDNFKAVNDNYDHATGDRVIREALETVENAIQGAGELFHRSGDEMLVLLPNVNDAGAKEIAERIRAAVEQKNFSTIGRGSVTTTIGLATYPGTWERWEDLENVADQTAMKAKRVRKNWAATCLDNFDVPAEVTDGELADLQLELERIDALNDGRTTLDIVRAKRQKSLLLEKMVGRLRAEGRTAYAQKLERQIREIQREGRVSTPLQDKVDRLNDIEIERRLLHEEEKRKKPKR
jgi:diguanylate cyclase (GGDEF)-like protein